MMHLDDERLLDAVEGRMNEADAAHLDVCLSCRARRDDLQGVLARVTSVGDPAPSPLFWDHFRGRVADALAAAPPPKTRLAPGFRWLAAASALMTLALVVLAFGVRSPQQYPAESQIAVDAHDAAPLADDMDADEAWSLVRSVADDLDYESVRDAGVAPASGAIDRAALELTPSEQTALVKLLEVELKRTDS